MEWKHYTNSFLTAVIATIVQSFFVYRYWMLTRRWYICIVVIIGILLSIVAACLVIASLGLAKPPVNEGIVNPPPGGALSPERWSIIHFISAIIVDGLITVGTTWHLYNQKAGLARSHIGINIVLGKLYAMSLVYTLNIRNEIRSDRETSNGVSIGPRSFSRGVIPPRRGNEQGARKRGFSSWQTALGICFLRPFFVYFILLPACLDLNPKDLNPKDGFHFRPVDKSLSINL
ncbi:hypothetical protein CPB86DRAFT_800118 [Serendipita vermifera]|nr:hypothetical protein CPB86DRAFT_800118 [Serendipita vermifera]